MVVTQTEKVFQMSLLFWLFTHKFSFIQTFSVIHCQIDLFCDGILLSFILSHHDSLTHSLRHANSPAFSTFMKSVKTIRVLLFCSFHIYHSNNYCLKCIYVYIINYVLIFQSIHLNISEQDEYMLLSYHFRITHHRNTNMVYDGNGCILLTHFGEFLA